jgi:hypothetical protein
LGQARDLRSVLGYLLGPPGWSPDGSSKTAAQLRRDLTLARGAAKSAPPDSNV